MISISFNGVNSWTDLYLIPIDRPCIQPPEVRTEFVSVPGGNGSIDLTEALTGSPLYNNRIGTFNFIIARKNLNLSVMDETTGVLIVPDTSGLSDEGRTSTNSQNYWVTRYQYIMSQIHGKKGALIMSDDPTYFYKSRFWVDNWETGEVYSTVNIGYNASVYKYPTTYLNLYNSPTLEQYGVL